MSHCYALRLTTPLKGSLIKIPLTYTGDRVRCFCLDNILLDFAWRFGPEIPHNPLWGALYQCSIILYNINIICIVLLGCLKMQYLNKENAVNGAVAYGGKTLLNFDVSGK